MTDKTLMITEQTSDQTATGRQGSILDTRKQINALTKFSSRGYRNPTLIFAVAILVLTALSTHGTLDSFAEEQLNETTVESFVVYGVAMGLDATISVLQSFEAGAGLSIRFGEVLEPVDHAIERFSTVMLWALGSLVLQGVVLAFVSSNVFKWTFALIAFVALSTLIVVWRRRSAGASSIALLDRCCGVAVWVFAVAAIVRFIVPVFVIMGYLAGQALLQPEIDRQSEQLSAISEEVTGDDQQILEQATINENGLEGQNEQDPAAEDQRGFLERARDAAGQMLPDISMPDFSSLSVMVERVANLPEYLARLMVLFAVKNIVLPLIFLAIALKVAKPVAARLSAITAAIDRDLKSIKRKTGKAGSGDASALPAP